MPQCYGSGFGSGSYGSPGSGSGNIQDPDSESTTKLILSKYIPVIQFFSLMFNFGCNEKFKWGKNVRFKKAKPVYSRIRIRFFYKRIRGSGFFTNGSADPV